MPCLNTKRWHAQNNNLTSSPLESQWWAYTSYVQCSSNFKISKRKDKINLNNKKADHLIDITNLH
jgi:hypothetical protein